MAVIERFEGERQSPHIFEWSDWKARPSVAYGRRHGLRQVDEANATLPPA